MSAVAGLPAFEPGPVVLEGRHVRLVPLVAEHLDGLCAAGADAQIFRWMGALSFADRQRGAAHVDWSLGEATAGRAVPFTIVRRDDERLVGQTQLFDIHRADRGLEIGWTWIGRPWQRTPVNTDCKRLLLGHLFDDLGALRVQLKTDSRNTASRAAMERIGCQFEGVLRNHRVLPDGSLRHSAFYSVIREEWPTVRAHLDGLLTRAD